MKANGSTPRAPDRHARPFRSLALIGLAALLPAGHALAAGKFTCSIADPGSITVGAKVTFSGTVSGSTPPYSVTWTFPDATPASVPKTGVQSGVATTADTTFNSVGTKTVSLVATDTSKGKAKTCSTSRRVTVLAKVGVAPTARGDTYATPVGKTLVVQAARVSGVLYNDFDVDTNTGEQVFGDTPAAGLTAELVTGPSNGTLSGGLGTDGSFTYIPNGQGDNTNDSFTYRVKDADGALSNVATVNIHTLSDQPDFKILMNYELGMHCTGFEFSYCCILPPYNSIVAQVVKPQAPGTLASNADYPRVLEGDPNNGLDGLGRETVLRDYDGSGNFQKYYLEYYHDAMPRREGNMPGTFNSNNGVNTLISDIEGNSMLYWNTPYDSAAVDATTGKLKTATYAGVPNVVVGDGHFDTATNMGIPGGTDNFANGWLNHLYIYADLEGSNPDNTSLEKNKIRLGVAGMVEYPANSGAALQPMGPTGNGTGFDNVLTFSGDTGTVVYTQSKVLENLPIQLTSPKIWEALGLPLTPFEDSIGFFNDPGSVDEDSVRPFVAMKAKLHEANCDEATGTCTKGDVVIGSNGQPVIGFGAAPIDIPNCERCHSAPAMAVDGVTPNVNSPSYVRRQGGPDPFYGPGGETLEAITDLEIEYWKSVYPSLQTGTDWYARLKGAAINMMMLHDYDVGTNFTANYPTSGTGEPLVDLLGLPASKLIPQNTRMGHESVICQKCHGDNVIAAVKSAGGTGWNIPPISEAIHNSHKAKSAGGPIVFNDSLGRFGGCQGCHPAHRSDGSMDKYPITYGGNNANAAGDNRTGKGGCFVGRDVHSNPLKDEKGGAETPSHLNAVGNWLVTNVAKDTGEWRGIWCTNCHTQLSQELWRTEDCDDLINGKCKINPRAASTLSGVASAVGITLQQAIDYLDPKNPAVDSNRKSDQTHAAWSETIPDANVAAIEVTAAGTPVGKTDGDGDFSVNILSFCTTTDCVNTINANKANEGAWRYPEGGAVDGTAGFINTANKAAAVPFSAATAGRDHWLAAGEPHCADCHAAPYVEQTGNQSPLPPFNYPAKAGLMRYSKGHQGISCQGCHESIHGLYPVGPAIDNTSYAQAAALNHDGSHGPLKCGTCHAVDTDGVPFWIRGTGPWGGQYIRNFDAAVGWSHTYTDDANVLDNTCQNCHGDEADEISATESDYLKHAYASTAGTVARTSRVMMDKAEVAQLGHVLGATAGSERTQLCTTCHSSSPTNKLGTVTCSAGWKQHLTKGMVAESVWEAVSEDETGTLCGW